MRVVRAMGVAAVPSVVLAVLWPTWAGRGAFRCFSVSDSEQRSVHSERSWGFCRCCGSQSVQSLSLIHI